MKTLILGGVRSGKSRLAEKLAMDSGLPVTTIVTATGDDDEMQRRIAAHRQRRPAHWLVVEEPLQLAGVLHEYALAGRCVLVDCLTLWLNNRLMQSDISDLEEQCDAVVEAVSNTLNDGEIILVGNETSMGIIPLGELTRQYCDQAGRLHQQMATVCDRVVLTVAGLPLYLKGAASEKPGSN